jgi:hypothetical protein
MGFEPLFSKNLYLKFELIFRKYCEFCCITLETNKEPREFKQIISDLISEKPFLN